MAKLNFKNKWILITGASSGLGREIARLMAKYEQANLVIAARRLDRLTDLKTELESTTSSSVITLEADVSTAEKVEALFQQATETADIYGVINNAGITAYGPATVADMDFYDTIVDVNFKALTRLTLKFLDYFKQKGGGVILNVTSEASFVPIPYQAVYSASKHAAQAFTEALAMENRGGSVVISTYAPGGIATEMLTSSGLDKKHGLDSPFNMDPVKCARLAIKSLKRKKFVYVPGFMNQMTVFLIRFFPRKWVARITEIIYRPVKD